ncbi:MAG TPA: SDR family NAD(P)-dependent oxidoreductase [Gemmatimonadales bacterium]
MPNRRMAIVTGTSSGIGEQVARQLLQRGWEVIGIARRPVTMETRGYAHCSLDLAEVTRLTANLETQVGSRIRDSGVTRLGLVNNAADVALQGQVDQLQPTGMLQAYAANTVAPVLLIGWVLRTAAPRIPVRIVNVSSGAGVEPFPGLGSYGATKAALRLAGMVLGAELDMRAAAGAPRDATVWSYEPGVVETPMQEAVRAARPETVPVVQVFHDLAAHGQLRPADAPAKEIVSYLEADGHPRFSEQRFLLS